MDDYLFKEKLDVCRTLFEETTGVEIFNYSEPLYDVNKESPLPDETFNDFLLRKGEFAPPENLPSNVKLLSGIRLIVQQNARHADTFMPKVISLHKDVYEAMVHAMGLPTKHIETTAAVGPFIWHHYHRHNDDPCFQIVYRDADTHKRDKMRGFEMALSYSFKTKLTNVCVKGAPNSDLVRALQQLRASPSMAAHPMALPVAFLANDLSETNDQRQRDARVRLQHIENFTLMRGDGEEHSRYGDVLLALDGTARDLTECYAHVLWRPPVLYSSLVERMGKAMRLFANLAGLVQEEDLYTASPEAIAELRTDSLQQLHDSFLSRLEFTQAKLTGLQYYRDTTLERLKLQRESLYNIMSQRDARLSVEMAKVAQATERNVSSNLWIYFVITIPVTAALVASWIWFERRRQSQYEKDDANFKFKVNRMEKIIVKSIQKKTAVGSPWAYA